MELRFNISINFERNYLAAYFSSFAFSDLCNTDVVPSFQVVFVNNPLLWLPLYFFIPLERNNYVQQNSMQKHKNSNKPECKWKSLMCWPAILLTLINNLGTIGTWCSSPSHIIYPIISRAVLSLLSFGALRSLGSSVTNRSLVSFRTRRAWEWLVFVRLACFSWKEKDLPIWKFFSWKSLALMSSWHFFTSWWWGSARKCKEVV